MKATRFINIVIIKADHLVVWNNPKVEGPSLSLLDASPTFDQHFGLKKCDLLSVVDLLMLFQRLHHFINRKS
jgi:hypothetical protein